ncbi:MAG: ABC transporter ATP-binding protein [Myxococcota bacterium]
MTASVVHASDLRFRYANSGFSLHVPELRVQPGEAVALVGPSGCGKSTLMELLSGTLSAGSGSLMVAGTELVGLSESARRRHRLRRLGLVFQDYPLVDHLDATENVLLPYRIGGLRRTPEVLERAGSLLGTLGLAGKERRRPSRLSQGERQRVSLARALVTQPQIVLADEPTTGLDAKATAGVLELLVGQCRDRGVTLVVVTHDPAVVVRLDRGIEVDSFAAEGP